jgi:CubicO group peptidase (beta-lactamase class C family)
MSIRLVFVIIAAMATSVVRAVPLTAEDAAAFLDGMLPTSMAMGDIAGATVAIVKDDAVLLVRGYGFADVEKRIAVDSTQTLFRPASISKLFTASTNSIATAFARSRTAAT